MTKSPTRESPQANKEPPPRQRNIYDYEANMSSPLCSIGRQTLQVA
jgi:hypothetical protein